MNTVEYKHNHDVRFIKGEKIRNWGGWYRHDKVIVDGKELEGFIQVRTNGRGGRESTTHFRNACIMGDNWAWLYAQNQLVEKGESRPWQ